MKYFFTTGILVLFILAWFGNQDEILPSEYVEYIRSEDSGLHKKFIINNCKYSLLLKPLDYLISQELRSNNITSSQYEKSKKLFEDAMYIDLSHQCSNEKEAKLSLYLLNGIDTIKPSFLHREATGGIKPAETDLYIFPKLNTQELKFIISHDEQHEIVLITRTSLENLPKLKTHS